MQHGSRGISGIVRRAKQHGLECVVAATGDARLYTFLRQSEVVARAKSLRDAEWFMKGWRARSRTIRQARERQAQEAMLKLGLRANASRDEVVNAIEKRMQMLLEAVEAENEEKQV